MADLLIPEMLGPVRPCKFRKWITESSDVEVGLCRADFAVSWARVRVV